MWTFESDCFIQRIRHPALLLPINDPVTKAFAAKHWHRIHPTKLEPAKIRPFLAWRPVNIIAKTLKHTTQLARMSIYHPLRKHIKARFPILNVPRLFKPVSADQFYANTCDIAYGYTCSNVFYGMQTSCINVYGHSVGGDGAYNSYKDFCREHGVPSTL